jgi:hypothetical protein
MGQKIHLRLRRPQDVLAPLLRWLGSHESMSANLRLQTKFLLSLVGVIATLTFFTLLIAGRAAEELVQKAVEQDTRNSLLTFQNVRAERQLELNREAEILATLPTVKALMANEDSANVQGASEEVWRPGNADLFAMSDWTGKIVALHTTMSGFPKSAAEEMFTQSRGVSESGGGGSATATCTKWRCGQLI